MSTGTFLLMVGVCGCILLGGILIRAGIELLLLTPDEWAEIEQDAIARERRSISLRRNRPTGAGE